jgi:aminoglycoside phosphotransferase family enzyme
MERRVYERPVESLFFVRESFKTSTSSLCFTKDHVYKVLDEWDHPLITDLAYYPGRFKALQGEMLKGSIENGINKGNSTGVYEGIVAVSQGDYWDFALKMKRFADEQRMDKLLTAGDLSEESAQKAVSMIIDYHRGLPVTENANKRGEAGYFKNQVMEKDLDLALSLISREEQGNGEVSAFYKQIEALKKNEGFFLEQRSADFTQAIENEMVKNAHGDPKLTNCFVSDGSVGKEGEVYFLDAIAFNDDWSCGDLRSEIAYFLLQFDFEKPDEFDYWLRVAAAAYGKKTGDYTLLSQPLFWFYLNYRAWVEGKVALLEAEANPKRFKDAEKYFGMAEKYLRKAYEQADLDCN